MKKILKSLCAVIITALVFSMSACGGGSSQNSDPGNGTEYDSELPDDGDDGEGDGSEAGDDNGGEEGGDEGEGNDGDGDDFGDGGEPIDP